MSRARVLFHVDDTSDALFEWKTQEHSLCHCFTFLRLLICLFGLFPPPSFHTSPVGKATLTLSNVVHSPFLFLTRLLLIWLAMAGQYASLVSITTCLLGSSETSRPTWSRSVCELLFVASGCFQLERGHRHCLKVVISQHWFEATVEIGNNVGYYNPQLQ